MRSAVIGLAVLTLATLAGAEDTFDKKTASFSITFHDETTAYRDAALAVMPG